MIIRVLQTASLMLALWTPALVQFPAYAEEFSIPVRIIEEPSDRNGAREREASSEKRDVADLIAQQSMAKSTDTIVAYTWWQLVLAAFSAIVAAVGTGGLIYSLVLNRRATNAAVAAATAAQDAIATERAWLMHDGIETGSFINGTSGEKKITNGLAILTHWQNSGRSPAVDVRVFGAFKLWDGDEENVPFFDPKDFPPQTRDVTATVGPNNGIHNALVLDDEEATQFRSGEKKLLVYGRTAYQDIFTSTRRHTEVCAELTIQGTKQDANGQFVPHIALRPLGKQNTLS